MSAKDIIESKRLQAIENKIKDIDNFATNQIVNNIITRQGIEQNQFKLKSIDDDQLTNISKNMNEFHQVSNIFGRRSSSFSRINLTLNHITPYQNLKQCVSEIENKRLALKENLFNLKKKVAKLKFLKRELADNPQFADYEREMKKIEIEEIESSIVDIRLYIEGALKEIAIFQQAYQEKCDEFNIYKWDEEDLENAEAEYHIKRCFNQCIRNVTEFGRIRDDNQEWLQQLGINPIVILVEIQRYVEICQKQLLNPITAGYNHTLSFINELYYKYKNHYLEMLKMKGIKNTYNKQVVYKRD